MKNISIEIPVTLDNFIYSNHIVLLREHDNKVILLILLTAIIYYSIFSLFQCQIKLYTDILKIKKVIKSTSKVLKLIKKVSFFFLSFLLGNILVNDIYQNQYSVTLWDQFSSYKLKILAYLKFIF